MDHVAHPAPACNIPGLLAGPLPLFSHSFLERWTPGAHAVSRLRCLRAAGLTPSARTTAANPFTGTVAAMELRYTDAQGRAPALTPPTPKAAPTYVFRIARGRRAA